MGCVRKIGGGTKKHEKEHDENQQQKISQTRNLKIKKKIGNNRRQWQSKRIEMVLGWPFPEARRQHMGKSCVKMETSRNTKRWEDKIVEQAGVLCRRRTKRRELLKN